MINVDVISVQKQNSFKTLEALAEIFKQKFKGNILRVDYDQSKNMIKIFLKNSVALATIDRLSTILNLNSVKVKELRWKEEKALNGGTCFLHIVVS